MKRYEVVINGIATTLQLSDADAAAQGLTPAQPAPVAAEEKAKTPANKSRQPSNKARAAAPKG